MGHVLVTGANGFIGKNLINKLLTDGHTVYAQVRSLKVSVQKTPNEKLFFIKADFSNGDDVQRLYAELQSKGILASYYLIHSMSDRLSKFNEIELTCAKNYVWMTEALGVQQNVYLSGIIDVEKPLSAHLRSRYNVEKELLGSKVPCTVLRASIIIGAGSASFEIIRDLVEKLPIMVAPKWVKSLCQPIAITDVIYYLSKVLLHKPCYRQSFDIGGPCVLTFKEVLLQYAKVRSLKRFIITVPVLTPKLSSYWLVLVTSVPYSLASYLVQSMKCNTVCKEHTIDTLLPHTCLSFKEAIRACFQQIESYEVVSTWIDSWNENTIDEEIEYGIQVPKEGCFIDEQGFEIQDSKNACQQRIWSLGGTVGWYAYDWAWRVRGAIDQLLGGVGLNRGRRDPYEIKAGDTIDFWRVLKADDSHAHLILYAIMKVPGDAWLEFYIDDSKKKPILIQRATFRPRGVFGRIYWYLLYPFHELIFRKMAKKIAGF